LDRPSTRAEHERPSHLGATVELRYVARAGLLPELSRQTYDSFYKAIRESVLNAIDARSTRVDLDFSRLATSGEFVVSDDGAGMSMHEFCDQFMSLGGSTKFGESGRFGRIGIGSLALLHYGQAAIVETKQRGAPTFVRAHIEHPWNLDRDARRTYLEDLRAGTAEEFAYGGSTSDHFTRVKIVGATPELRGTVEDPSSFYALIEKLRRVLPLPWKDSRLTETLDRLAPSLTQDLREHTRGWSIPVLVHSEWEHAIPITRRLYGDDAAGVEGWVGPPVPLHKQLRVVDDAGTRLVTVAGFLLNQRQPLAAWSGVTARLQNVAIEEQTFFDITADPGFRKYITGEVWLLGDVDRDHLINIDRSTFNRECSDYKVIQRYVGQALLEFKAAHVQRPQRQKVEVRRILEHRRLTLEALQKVARNAEEDMGVLRLPSSEPKRKIRGERVTLDEALADVGASVVPSTAGTKAKSYSLTVDDAGDVIAEVDESLRDPTITVGGVSYEVSFVRGRDNDPAVVIRNRPSEITFNLAATSKDSRGFQLHFALELAYLLSWQHGPEAVYDAMSDFIEAI
jgi:Histidine kinase-, DNA gyrase B-, and HSP90-like ATPase